MGGETKIQWCDHTFNPWTGCQAVSEACDHCYAEALEKRFGHADRWGPHGTRKQAADSTWKLPLKWNRDAAAAGVRRRVFCASMADVFDNRAQSDWRERLWRVIAETPHLDWLLLTKRPQNIAGMLPTSPVLPRWNDGWPNVWLGTTAEDEAHYRQRWTHLAAVPARLRFLSYEPALGPIGNLDLGRVGAPNWVICGGESGHKARPMHPQWARDVRDQCAAAGTPFFFKQWGEFRESAEHEIPERFGDECDRFRCVCSNGFVGALSLESAFIHKPSWWSQCFPNGADGDAVCSNVTMIRVGKKAAGTRLDGKVHQAFPE